MIIKAEFKNKEYDCDCISVAHSVQIDLSTEQFVIILDESMLMNGKELPSSRTLMQDRTKPDTLDLKSDFGKALIEFVTERLVKYKADKENPPVPSTENDKTV